MAWNGTGTYVLNPLFSPEANGNLVDAVRYNGLTLDIAAGISNAIAKNGENVPTGDLPMAGYKHTGAGDATEAGEYLVFGQAPLASDLLGVDSDDGSNLVGYDYQIGYDDFTVGAALNGLFDSIQNVFGTTGQIVITDDGSNELTWSLADELNLSGTLLWEGQTAPLLPAAGQVGEIVEQATSSVSVTFTSGTNASVASIELTPGYWEISGTLMFKPGSGFAPNFFGGGINLNPAELPTNTYEQTIIPGFTPAAAALVATWAYPVPMQRIYISTTSTYHLVARASFGAGSCQGGGHIIAKRYL